MTDVIIVALVTTAVQVVGSILNSRLTIYRIDQLEKKVEKHNCLVERMVIVEQSTKAAHNRINEIKDTFDT